MYSPINQWTHDMLVKSFFLEQNLIIIIICLKKAKHTNKLYEFFI